MIGLPGEESLEILRALKRLLDQRILTCYE